MKPLAKIRWGDGIAGLLALCIQAHYIVQHLLK